MKRLVARFPGLLTIIVPRHARRGDEIADLAAARGVSALQRSREPRRAALPELYIADTTGELGLFYRLASASFVGKSLIGRGGGQNPIEPAKLGCAVLHGPHVGNFAEAYRALGRGARCRRNQRCRLARPRPCRAFLRHRQIAQNVARGERGGRSPERRGECHHGGDRAAYRASSGQSARVMSAPA